MFNLGTRVKAVFLHMYLFKFLHNDVSNKSLKSLLASCNESLITTLNEMISKNLHSVFLTSWSIKVNRENLLDSPWMSDQKILGLVAAQIKSRFSLSGLCFAKDKVFNV